jgi:pimeloyl-ACP methyl ester carboxylesterase
MTSPFEGPHRARVSAVLRERLRELRRTHPARVVESSRGAVRYFVIDDADRTVTLLHGGGSNADATHPFALALAGALRVVCVDWPDTARSVDDVLDAVIAVLDRERIAVTSLLGFSQGGMIAQCFARRFGTRTDKLALYVSMGPSARYAKRFARYRTILSLVPEALLVHASRRAVARWAAGASDKDDAELIVAERRAAFDERHVTKATLLSDAAILVDFFGRTFAPGEVGAPVLIVEAERDRMVDDVERAALRALYPQARVLTLPASDHFAGVLAPPSITDPLLAFLRG